MPEPWRTLLTLLLGVFTGILSAMFGVGGAILSTPGIRALGASAFEAIGSTLPSIIPSAVTGSLRYSREGLVEWRVVTVTGGIGSVAAVGGSFLSHAVPGRGHLLMVTTAVLMGFTAFRVGTGRVASERSLPPLGSPARRGWRRGTIGVAAGGLSGLLGVGGGIVMLPAFTGWLGMPVKEAVATSLACVGILAVPATVSHALLGDIDWGVAIPLAIGVIPGAALGAALAIRATERRLQVTIGVVMGAVAVVYATLEILALL